MQRWTAQEDKLLAELYPDHTNQEIADRLGRSLSAVKNRGQARGLQKNSSHLQARAGRFEEGHESFNKGLKGYRTKGSEKGWFKKGHLPHTTKPNGAITKRGKYLWIRLGKDNWKALHRHIWEQHHGEIKKDEVIIFNDGDQTNCKIENLKKIKRADNARRNHNPDKLKGKPHKLTDKVVVGYMCTGDPELREQLLQCPELIEAKRTEILLNREIKHHEKK